MRTEGKFKVVYSAEAHFRMYAYARAAKGEVTGFGQVHQRGDTLYVDDIYIVPQKATGAGVHVDADTLQDFMAWCKKTKRNDRLNNLRLWWHSHVDMGCFRSGTDRATCELLLQVMPWLLCVVVNKKGQHETTLHLKDPARMTFMHPRVETRDYPYTEWKKECDAQVATMVRPWVHETKEEPVQHKKGWDGPVIINPPSDHTHDYQPGLFVRPEGESAEEVYLSALDSGAKETPWDRYKRERGLFVPRDETAFRTDGLTDDEIRQLPIGAMTNAQVERYCLMYEPEEVEQRATKKGDTRRYIIEEGTSRPERTSDK